MTAPTPEVVHVGDRAVLVVFADSFDEAALARVRALDAALGARPATGLVEVVPATTTLLVDFDPLLTDHEAITRAVRDCLGATTQGPAPTRHVIDVCYDDRRGPDLASVAERAGLDVEATITAHLAGHYTVTMFGFVPGSPYLHGTPASIRLPRKAAAGPPVPAGSVIVAGEQCVVLPIDVPTGWWTIGCTPAAMLNGDSVRPFRLDVGDIVTFRRIDAAEFERQRRERSGGRR